MLNREEYNEVFCHDLTQEEFEKLQPITLGPENVNSIESLSFVDRETKEIIEFVRVVRCGQCNRRCKALDDDKRNEIFCEFMGVTMEKNDFCSRGKDD